MNIEVLLYKLAFIVYWVGFAYGAWNPKVFAESDTPSERFFVGILFGLISVVTAAVTLFTVYGFFYVIFY